MAYSFIEKTYGGNMNQYRNRNHNSRQYEKTEQSTIGEKFNQNEITNMPLAMVYSEKQSFDRIFDIREALPRGTIFKDLYFPLELN